MPDLIRVAVADSKIGSKGFLINKKGRFVLEEEPSVFRVLACTAAGAGGFTVYDGVTNYNGHFPIDHHDGYDNGYDPETGRWKYDKRWTDEEDKRNGRIIFKASPAILGSWMFDVQAHYGLVLAAEGGAPSALTFATATWMKGTRGNKSFFFDRKGTFCLEKGLCSFKGVAITHGGTGGVTFYDGVPDDQGFFPEENMPEDDPGYWTRNGRPIFIAHPPWQQMWFPDAGCVHGLSIRIAGGDSATSPLGTVIWAKARSA